MTAHPRPADLTAEMLAVTELLRRQGWARVVLTPVRGRWRVELEADAPVARMPEWSGPKVGRGK
jgi:hypothetical protein